VNPQFGTASDPDTTVTLPMAGSMTVTATYTSPPKSTLWKLTVVNGTAVTPPDQAGGYYNAGTVVEISATVPADKVFTGWTADIANPQFGDTSKPDTTIKMTTNITVTAHLQDKNQPPTDPRSGSGCRNDSGTYEAAPQDTDGKILGGLRITNAASGQCFDWSMTRTT